LISDSSETEVTERRFGGMNRLFGAHNARRIQQVHMAVVGIGGVGSWAAEALARSGVSRLTLIDMDHIAESNINRQLHALSSTLGQAKVLAMQDRIRLINPDCVVFPVDEFIAESNINEYLHPDIDLVIDATDQVSAKVAMAAWALQSAKPLVMVGAAGGKKWAHKVDMADLSDVSHDPLLAQVRQQLRKKNFSIKPGTASGVQAVFSKEPVTRPSVSSESQSMDNTLNCHGYGSLVAVTATFGQCAAGWALNHFSQ
jgi:tRNA A37 threonylcarbamoyladenosine dehydratase